MHCTECLTARTTPTDDEASRLTRPQLIPGPYSLTTGARQYMIQPFIARGRAPKPPYFLRFKGSRESK